MAQQTINLGAAPDDGTGDTLRAGGDKINDNFDELYDEALKFKGSTDCSTNPNYPAALKGDAYRVSVAGKIGGASGVDVEIADLYFATADNAGGDQATVGTSWSVLQGNITSYLPLSGGTLTGDLIVPDEAYDATNWDGNLEVPTKNAVRDKIESLGAGTITELDDIPDVNAPAPANGEVLTWDSTPGEWVSQALPGAGSFVLDDATDVNAPTPTNGDVLTWDSTPGEWVSSAPAAGGGWTQILASTSIPNPSAQYDVSGLSGYSEILIIARNMTTSAAGFRVVQAGKSGTFYSTSGDYKGISTTTGAESNAADWGGNGSSTASAATIITRIMNNKTGAVPVSYQAASVPILFVGTTAPIDSARIKNTSGNLTGGTVEVWGRA